MSNSGSIDIVQKRISEWIEKGDHVRYLDLSNLGLTEIPDLPVNVQRVLLQNNKIKKIYNLPITLTVLNCSNNEVELIDANLPDRLIQLLIYRNNLCCLPCLPDSLECLDISYNNINMLPNIPINLKKLYCWNNPLPFELIESDNLWMYDICEESHKNRIILWKKYTNL